MKLAALGTLGAVLAIAGVGCVSARINVVDERTALESQILGSYEELDREVLQLASVRAGGESRLAIPNRAAIRERALRARQTQQFNLDDVTEYQAAGCLGEGRDGLLALRPCEAGQPPKAAQRLGLLVTSENEAREVLLEFVVTTSPDLTRDDLAQVRSVWARMNREAAPAGSWIQHDDGEWVRR